MRIIHLRAALLLAAFGGASGCGSLPDGTRWGAAATLTPGWNRVEESALDAARSPWVWAPLAGAAVLQVGSWDEDLAEWAREETPVFGSESSAAGWSDDFRTATVACYAVSVLATPSGAVDGDWFAAKARGVAIGAGAIAAGTAWARVEAGAHCPSDVLAGVALGNFMGAFFTQAFLGLEPGERLASSAEPTRGRHPALAAALLLKLA